MAEHKFEDSEVSPKPNWFKEDNSYRLDEGGVSAKITPTGISEFIVEVKREEIQNSWFKREVHQHIYERRVDTVREVEETLQERGGIVLDTTLGKELYGIQEAGREAYKAYLNEGREQDLREEWTV